MEGKHEDDGAGDTRRDTSIAAEIRATLHRLVDALPESELAAALRLLEELAGVQPSGPRDYDQH